MTKNKVKGENPAAELIKLVNEPYPATLKTASELLNRFDAALAEEKRKAAERAHSHKALLRKDAPLHSVNALMSKDRATLDDLLKNVMPFRDGLAARVAQLEGEKASKEAQNAREQHSGLSQYA